MLLIANFNTENHKGIFPGADNSIVVTSFVPAKTAAADSNPR